MQFSVFPENGIRGNAPSLLERLDVGKNFPEGKDLGSRQGREYMVVVSPPLGNLSAGHSHLGPGQGRGGL